jgi:hypothetical protein
MKTSNENEVMVMDVVVDNLFGMIQNNISDINQPTFKEQIKDYMTNVIAAFIVHQSIFSEQESREHNG